VVWHPDPLSLDEHLHPGRLHPVGRRATIPIIAAIPSGSVLQRRVDVVGFGGRLKADEEQDREEARLERHRPLSLMTGWRRSSERRNNATPAILLPSEALVVHSQGRQRSFETTLHGTLLYPEEAGSAPPRSGMNPT